MARLAPYQKYEKCERRALFELSERMNTLHAVMGGRDSRPERVALIKCMRILERESKRSKAAFINSASTSE